jgi:hypothetical protein
VRTRILDCPRCGRSAEVSKNYIATGKLRCRCGHFWKPSEKLPDATCGVAEISERWLNETKRLIAIGSKYFWGKRGIDDAEFETSSSNIVGCE